MPYEVPGFSRRPMKIEKVEVPECASNDDANDCECVDLTLDSSGEDTTDELVYETKKNENVKRFDILNCPEQEPIVDLNTDENIEMDETINEVPLITPPLDTSNTMDINESLATSTQSNIISDSTAYPPIVMQYVVQSDIGGLARFATALYSGKKIRFNGEGELDVEGDRGRQTRKHKHKHKHTKKSSKLRREHSPYRIPETKATKLSAKQQTTQNAGPSVAGPSVAGPSRISVNRDAHAHEFAGPSMVPNSRNADANEREKNTDPTWFFNSKKAMECHLCFKRYTKRIVWHYKKEHPESEVFPSRISSRVAEKARSKSIEANYEDQSNYPEPLVHAHCYMCDEVKKFHAYYWEQHYTTHTGEYMYQCTGNGCEQMVAAPYHCNQACSKKAKPVILRIQDLTGYLCMDCNYVQLNEKNIRKHLRSEHGYPNTSNRWSKIVLVPSRRTVEKRSNTMWREQGKYYSVVFVSSTFVDAYPYEFLYVFASRP